MTRDEFLEKVKTLGFPVLVQGREQLAQRRGESLEEMNRALSENNQAEENSSSIPDSKDND